MKENNLPAYGFHDHLYKVSMGQILVQINNKNNRRTVINLLFGHYCYFELVFDELLYLKLFQPNVVFHTETNHLF